MEPLEQSDNFRRVYQFASETNQSVFLTGKAGTGKTTLLKYIRENCFKQISVVAPTGVAAINAGGTTIHSFFQLPFTPFLPPENKTFISDESKHLLATIKLNSTRLNVMRQLDLLIIDEISMVRCDILDEIDVVLRSVRRRYNQPFGGVQVIMIGDMYQLPPVVKEEEWNILQQKYKSPFFFDSMVMEEAKPVYIELEKIYRQDDADFIDLLNKVRNNQMDEATLELLNSRFKNDHVISNDAIVLTTHNYMADNINARELEKLETRERIYEAEISGIFSEKAYPAEVKLKLKVGASVMFIRNDKEKRFFNGKCGKIKALTDDNISVLCNGDDYDITITTEEWENIQYKLNKETNKIEEEIIGTFMQFPLRLAWAVTIHKSQGLTFDKVVIDAAKAFSAGQVYVALSRCRSLNGITLTSQINKNSLANDEKIISFASQKTPEDKVSAFMQTGRANYIRNIFFDIFNIKTLESESIFIDRKIYELQKQFLNPDMLWVKVLNDNIASLGKVSDKFINELNGLLEVNEAESKEKINERLQKASTYFIEKLNNIKDHLIACPWITESILASKEINSLLDDLYSNITFKIHLLGSCQSPFDLHAYTKLRQTYKRSEFKFKTYGTGNKKSGSNAVGSNTSSNISNPLLFMALEQLRDQICEAENKPIYLVANRNSLLDMAKYLPSTKEALIKIHGFGKAKVDAMGERFLDIIKTYMEENGIESSMEMLVIKKGNKQKAETVTPVVGGKTSRVSTYIQTLDHYKQGKTMEQIAELRNLAVSTIHSHLVTFVSTGELKMEELLSEDKIKELEIVIAAYPVFNSLTEIKEKCRDSISFADIRCFLAGKSLLIDGKQ